MTTATPFLENLVKEFQSTDKQDFADQLLVFPNRRAGLFFKQALSRTLDGPIWAPQVQSIQDFVAGSVPLIMPGKISLLLELHKAYHALGIAESFDHFYSWGEVLLRDFDEIDKYLVDGEEVFQEILDIKTIEAAFDPDDPQSEALAQFWRNVQADATQNTGVGEAFLRIWRTNRAVYQQFRQQLEAKGWAYEGMAYRFLAENPDQGQYGSWSVITFAGFNALSPAEKNIIQHWQNQDKAVIYWDADPYYLDDPKQEAGHFLRRHFRDGFQRPEAPWIDEHLRNSPKQIYTYGVPLNVGQAKALGQTLDQQAENLTPERTAVVLPDEHMLFPTLNALPREFDDVNVTMGFPLRNTPFYSLFQGIITMQKEAGGASDEKRFYYREVLSLLRHPYLYPVAPSAIKAVEQWVQQSNAIFIRAIQLQKMGTGGNGNQLFQTLFQGVETVEEAFSYFKDVLLLLQRELDSGNPAKARVEQAFLYHYHVQLQHLTEALRTYEVGLSLDTYWHLFSQLIQQEQLPFNGEPLKGLQVMGLLETRNLDFDHLYILSANEGQMPPKPKQQSFIPFNVRKAFGLPTQDEDSALFAYHFYRLLQRAETVTFFYDTEQSSLDKGEQSRFLPQLKLELAKENPQVSFIEQTLNSPLAHTSPKPITIPKNKGVWHLLTAMLGSENQGPDRPLSPSALLTYVSCPLKFYFRYILGLKEAEAVQEEVAPDVMGTIFHHAAAKLYRYYWQRFGAEVTADGLSNLDPLVENMVDEAFSIHFQASSTDLQGGNQLVRDVMIRQLKAVLENDKTRTPFQLLGLETQQFKATLHFEHYDFQHHVELTGTVDRIEKDDRGVQILDYKTGNIQNPPKNFEKIFDDPERFASSIQLLWYSYVVKEAELNDSAALRAAIYPVKTLNNTLVPLKANEAPFERGNWEAFEEWVTRTLQGLFDPQEPFYQTENLETCQSCPFNGICYRQYS